MSGIAGIVRFDGAPIEPGLAERMTAAIKSRGPDGMQQWRKGPAAFGQCMLRTTPESLEETQPLASEDQSLVLTMDGRVDNCEDLRRELLARGIVLRGRSDAELVLRAYQAWGEECPKHIIGEFVFFIWDSRHRRLFGARDAAGTRHFYYHAGKDWFAFASEIAGLLALQRIEPRLNESRLLDYLVEEFDRDDEVGTFYQGISRMPAGHAMRVNERGPETWRYWSPGDLPALRFRSLDECVEAFREQLRVAVKCRLRSNGPVGAMLSGGLDSSSIVGLISKEFRGELRQPLQTYSLIREDREKCLDWKSIREMLQDSWLEPTIVTSAAARAICRRYVEGIPRLNEPFGLSHGLTDGLVYEAAHEKGCRVVLDGMASDLFYFGSARSLGELLRRGMYARIPAVLSAWRRHGGEGEFRSLAWTALRHLTPESARALYRRLRARHARMGSDLRLLHRQTAERYLEEKRIERMRAGADTAAGGDQRGHARSFTTGMLSFAHEVHGQLALSRSVEPRSPFSDRRMIEFGIRMPLEAKLYGPWYKLLLRNSMQGILPERVRWRRRIEGHPGWKFYELFIAEMAQNAGEILDPKQVNGMLARWIDPASLERAWQEYARTADYSTGLDLFRPAVLASWLSARNLGAGRSIGSTV
jgi:asparagine synthase (glutamine-hydrolysing)